MINKSSKFFFFETISTTQLKQQYEKQRIETTTD